MTYEEVKSLRKHALHNIESCVDNEDTDYASILDNYVLLHIHGKYDNAVLLYTPALEIRKKNPPETATSLNIKPVCMHKES